MINTKNIFKTTFKKRRNNYATNRIIKEDLYIPETAIELTNNEMEYINGGAIRVERYGFLGAGVRLVMIGTVSEILADISFVAGAISLGIALLSIIPVIGQIAVVKWVGMAFGAISTIAGALSIKHQSDKNVYKYEITIL